MVHVLQRLLSFEEFLEWYPQDGRRYELIDGEVNEMHPVGDATSRRWREHEELAGRITRMLDREIERLALPYLLPKSACIKPEGDWDGYVPDVIVLDRRQLEAEPLWRRASTITQGSTVLLVVEVVSTNWQDDYARKLEDYEAMGIQGYWIVDYRALGGKRFIGDPKRPTVTVNSLVEGRYQPQQFQEGANEDFPFLLQLAFPSWHRPS
ncbi:MAG: Uma2 family endonuclease [Synechococcaceae cyanobacterium SM2_3_2]|nr:Uma2 family endonuclease [Synechococcaceae cyanobacterium SM2_3_2]